MNLAKTSILLLLLLISFFSFAQTGPWAKYDQELKDDALYREASQGNLEEVKSIIAGGGNIHFVSQQIDVAGATCFSPFSGSLTVKLPFGKKVMVCSGLGE